uniref:Retrotransposon gag domain-containing protein n=1 Tax=Vitis vinifera TaxID=29760 RepID=A5BGB0_VITVI|nr:hypothetical protein VITISV_036153 [Vitis vinifera]
MRRLKHTSSIHDYVKEFSSLMLEIPNMIEEELLFNFMDNPQWWAEQELRRRGIQDLATTMVVAESLTDYKREDSSKVESLEDSHATEPRKLLKTHGAIYTKPLEGRVWKVLEMPRDVHTSLYYGGRHERIPRLSREF